jgi:drug/metabolite transporter (DMT)-like permease
VLQPFFAIAFAVSLLGEAADATTLAYAVAVVATVVAGRHFNNRAPRHGPGRTG